MSAAVKAVLGLGGGLAMFLYGMGTMSRALESAAGDHTRRMLSAMTGTPWRAAAAGALATAVLQSSSAATVMAVGFVSAGLMELPQAVAVVFGANIGTTVTAQLLAFRLGDIAPGLLAAGLLWRELARGERGKNGGLALFGFGLLFQGIELMSASVRPLTEGPAFAGLMGRAARMPVLGLVMGASMTAAVQSSSAVIAMLQRAACQAGPDGVSSVIGLAGAIPILLGSNIGTTVTALLACPGQSRDAWRTALAHTLFNLSGSLALLGLTGPFARLTALLSPAGPEVQVIARQIANAHTLFNLFTAALWLPLLPVMVRLVKLAVPDRPREQKSERTG